MDYLNFDNLRWNAEKDLALRERHGVGFADVVGALEEGGFLAVRGHPNTQKFGHQIQLVVKINDYANVVPAVLDGDGLFLKTLYPSRKVTAEYLGTGVN